MKEQKERAREARKALGDLGWAGVEFGKDVPATEFVGYDHSECDAKIVAIVADEELREEVAAGAEAVVVLDQSPFYAEMGGQVADHGTITADGVVFTVTDVQKGYLGEITDVDETTINVLLRVDHKGEELLIPAVEELITEADHEARSLTVSLPEGLIDL